MLAAYCVDLERRNAGKEVQVQLMKQGFKDRKPSIVGLRKKGNGLIEQSVDRKKCPGRGLFR